MKTVSTTKGVLIVIGSFVLIFLVAGLVAGGNSGTTTAPAPAPAPVTATLPASTTPPPPAPPAYDGAAFYDKVKNGMTKAQVVAVAGKSPDSCSESQIQGYGKSEYCTWYEGDFNAKTISITFNNDKVNTKSKYGY